eukprot:g2213.t1
MNQAAQSLFEDQLHASGGKTKTISLSSNESQPDSIGKIAAQRLLEGVHKAFMSDTKKSRLDKDAAATHAAAMSASFIGDIKILTHDVMIYMRNEAQVLGKALLPHLSKIDRDMTDELDTHLTNLTPDYSFVDVDGQAVIRMLRESALLTKGNESNILIKYDPASIPCTGTAAEYGQRVRAYHKNVWPECPEELLVAVLKKAATLVPGWEDIATAIEAQEHKQRSATGAREDLISATAAFCAVSQMRAVLHPDSHDKSAAEMTQQQINDCAELKKQVKLIDDGHFQPIVSQLKLMKTRPEDQQALITARQDILSGVNNTHVAMKKAHHKMCSVVYDLMKAPEVDNETISFKDALRIFSEFPKHQARGLKKNPVFAAMKRGAAQPSINTLSMAAGFDLKKLEKTGATRADLDKFRGNGAKDADAYRADQGAAGTPRDRPQHPLCLICSALGLKNRFGKPMYHTVCYNQDLFDHVAKIAKAAGTVIKPGPKPQFDNKGKTATELKQQFKLSTGVAGSKRSAKRDAYNASNSTGDKDAKRVKVRNPEKQPSQGLFSINFFADEGEDRIPRRMVTEAVDKIATKAADAMITSKAPMPETCNLSPNCHRRDRVLTPPPEAAEESKGPEAATGAGVEFASQVLNFVDVKDGDPEQVKAAAELRAMLADSGLNFTQMRDLVAEAKSQGGVGDDDDDDDEDEEPDADNHHRGKSN